MRLSCIQSSEVLMLLKSCALVVAGHGLMQGFSLPESAMVVQDSQPAEVSAFHPPQQSKLSLPNNSQIVCLLQVIA